MKAELLANFDTTTKELLETIQLFTQEQFNKVPFENSWTAGQVADHIAKAETGIPQVLKGTATATTGPVDGKVAVIKQIFLDFTTKLKSPDFIIPSAGPHDKDAYYQQLKDKREEIATVFNTADLNLTYTDFTLPNMGALTGIEWVVFLTSHSTRHIRQMNHIYKVLTNQ